MQIDKKPLVLVILDGYGYSEKQQDNAILTAKTPVMDHLKLTNPNTLISASSLEVGLPLDQMGNSEVGHTNIGAGRVVYQDLTRVSKDIADGEFEKNIVLIDGIKSAIAQNKAIHIMGLLSAGGVHSHEDHILAMIEMASKLGAKNIYLHAFLDGRDTPPKSAHSSLAHFETRFNELGTGQIASIIGRYYAMDRDNRWDRVEKAYNLIAESQAEYHASSAVEALQMAYNRDENDEFVKSTLIQKSGVNPPKLENEDTLIFMNFRADRAREISQPFFEPNFNRFKRERFIELAHFISLTEYSTEIATKIAYPAQSLNNTLGEWLAKHQKTQLRISETEKYAHVTFFFNGGLEQPFNGEERILVNSPSVATYDLQPEMSSEELTAKLTQAIESKKYDVIICNYPNGDMVGHTGVFDAAVKAIETLDACIGKVVSAVKNSGGQLLITADHGNAEKMRDEETGQVHTAHTNLPVPLIYVGSKSVNVVNGGKLSDLAPTMLSLMDMPIPAEMTGQVLFK